MFIVLDGVDGAGKGTQLAELRNALVARGHRVHTTSEPSDGPIGVLIRRYLRGELAGAPPGWRSMALLFAADRLHHLEHEILPHLAAGHVVLCDRYDASSIAYQSALGAMAASEQRASGDRHVDDGDDGALRWVAAMNDEARRPDLTILFDIDPEIATRRRHERGTPAELYERIELQKRIRAQYAKIPRVRPHDRIEVVDASPSVQVVHARILAIVEPLLAAGATAPTAGVRGHPPDRA